MCCGSDRGPKWKREVVKDHKFNSLDVRDFRDNSCGAKFSYMLMFVGILTNILTMTADLYTAVSLLVIGNSSINADASIPPEVAKWIFLGAILISFVLLFWDIIKARGIIASKDISLAFFAAIANGWYSTNDYNYFCLFRKINNSRKTIDSIAFFVFFTLKSWKRILLAEAPRQVINIVTLITIVPKWIHINDGLKIENDGLGKTRMQQAMTGTMIFSVVVFGVSFILFCAAAIIYIPFLCHIQGNLKEYCCHKVDKRIEELLQKQARRRMKGNDQAKKSQKNDIEMRSLAQSSPPKGNMKQLHPQPQPQIAPYNHHQQQDSYRSQPNQHYGHSNQPSYSSQGHIQQLSYNSQGHIQQPSYSGQGHSQQPSYSSQGHIKQPSYNSQGHNQQPSYSSQGHSQQPSYSSQGHTQKPGYNGQSYSQKPDYNDHGYNQKPHSNDHQSNNNLKPTGNHQQPGFYQQPSSANLSNVSTVMGSQYGGRRDSMSSVGSDQAGLTSHAQPPPRSSPYTNLANNIQQQQQQQQYQNYY